jgi:plastocyanin
VKKFLAISMVAAALVLVLAVAVASASGGKTVRLMGSETLKPNVAVFADLRFSPGPTVIGSGQTVTWEDQTGDPHTVTIADSSDLPKAFDDLFGGCPLCDATLGAHFGGQPVINFGTPGLNTRGDSLLIMPWQTVSAVVSAPAGTTLYYFCAIHTWMQGTLVVQ